MDSASVALRNVMNGDKDLPGRFIFILEGIGGSHLECASDTHQLRDKLHTYAKNVRAINSFCK